MTISFWLILSAALAYGLLHSLLASSKFKTMARSWFGASAERWIRLAFDFVAVITLLPILVIPIFVPDKEIYFIPFPWFILTLIIQAGALAALVTALHKTGITSFLGLRQIFLPEITSPSRLVTGGFYRYVRHPVYSAGLVILWLTPYLTWHLLALILGLTIYIFIGARYEERKLLTDFGEAYADYRRRTPMFVPRFRPRQITNRQDT